MSEMSRNKPKLNNFGSIFATPRYSECYAALAQDRIIFISEDITQDTANNFSALLMHYDQISEVDPINCYIDTSGGDASSLVQMVDLMELIKAPIKTIALSKAYSAGCFLLAAGTRGMRYAMRHSNILLHGVQAGINPDSQKKSQIYIEYLKSHNRQLLEQLAKNTNKTAAEVMKDAEGDLWMSPQEAKDYGIIDHIL